MSLDAEIDAYLDTLGIEEWRPLASDERDLLRRTVGRVPPTTPAAGPVADAA